MPLAVELRGISFAYDGGRPVLEDVDLAVEPGEFVAIAGPNGRKSLTIVWLTNTLRSARNKMRFLRRAFHKRQMIWNAV